MALEQEQKTPLSFFWDIPKGDYLLKLVRCECQDLHPELSPEMRNAVLTTEFRVEWRGRGSLTTVGSVFTTHQHKSWGDSRSTFSKLWNMLMADEEMGAGVTLDGRWDFDPNGFYGPLVGRKVLCRAGVGWFVANKEKRIGVVELYPYRVRLDPRALGWDELNREARGFPPGLGDEG